MTDFVRLAPADFLAYVQGLLPRGAAWPRDDDAVLTQLAGALADGAYAQHQATLNLSEVESDPNFTLELLPDWERDYGLPDTCTPLGATLQQRRAALLAKIRARGGQSAAYFIGVAAAVGYAITIERFYPFRVGQGRVGTPLYGQPWIFVWRVHAPPVSFDTYFRVGMSAVGEPLRTWGNDQLECILGQLKPAETVLLFAYDIYSAALGDPEGGFVADPEGGFVASA